MSSAFGTTSNTSWLPLPDPGGAGVLGRAHPDRAAVRARKSRGKKGQGNTYAKRIAVLAAYAAANTGAAK